MARPTYTFRTDFRVGLNMVKCKSFILICRQISNKCYFLVVLLNPEKRS